MQQIGLKPLINSYTRPTYNIIKSTSIIAHMFTNIDTNCIVQIGILLEELTGNLPIYANFNF